ncbi:hypothetical protein PsorP6_011758 [Peronosclerospora sorghi]|uniref:Uncharacterized protein n=1 Tax=Peronosclerospora sorghi TaxID=230839 RepID=A0ACC0WKK1_9STRA|nr:hypothetical protein PsorP6_011758 [Peronosclerospora sorghi]
MLCAAWRFARTQFVDDWESLYDRYFGVCPQSARDYVILGALVALLSSLLRWLPRSGHVRALMLLKSRMLPLLPRSSSRHFALQVDRLLLQMSAAKIHDVFLSLAADTTLLAIICTQYATDTTDAMLQTLMLQVVLRFAQALTEPSAARLSTSSRETITELSFYLSYRQQSALMGTHTHTHKPRDSELAALSANVMVVVVLNIFDMKGNKPVPPLVGTSVLEPFEEPFPLSLMSSAATTSESDLVLLVMLPADERVMLIQTSCLQTIGDLEKLILDQYARLFPHLPALCRDVRIQKRMSRALVMDHRTPLREDASHSFVDLAKNVQAGNVFQNMEQIYIVPNPEKKKKSTLGALESRCVQTEPHDVRNAMDQKSIDGKNDLEKVERVLKKDNRKEKAQDAKKKSSNKIEKILAKKATVQHTSDGKLAAVTNGGDKKVEQVKKDDATVIATKETDEIKESKKKNSGDSKKSIADKRTNKVLKKSAPKKRQNALLEQMRAVKQNPSESSAALLVKSLREKKRDVAGPSSNSDRIRKASQDDVTTEASETAAPMPPSKKQKTMKLESQPTIISDSESKPADKEMISAEEKKTSTKKDKTSKSSREKGTGTKTNSDDGSTASKIMPTSRIVKNMNILSDDVKGPVLKRAKANALPKTKKTSDKTKPSAKRATSETELSSSRSSNLSGSSSQEDEPASETEEDTQSATTVKTSVKTENLNENGNFRKILADKTRRIADGKKTKDANPVRAVKPEKKSNQTSESTESTAAELSDHSQHMFVGNAVRHSAKNSTPMESSSTSSSDEVDEEEDEEEEHNYSQRLLADLTKND